MFLVVVKAHEHGVAIARKAIPNAGSGDIVAEEVQLLTPQVPAPLRTDTGQ